MGWNNKASPFLRMLYLANPQPGSWFWSSARCAFQSILDFLVVNQSCDDVRCFRAQICTNHEKKRNQTIYCQYVSWNNRINQIEKYFIMCIQYAPTSSTLCSVEKFITSASAKHGPAVPDKQSLVRILASSWFEGQHIASLSCETVAQKSVDVCCFLPQSVWQSVCQNSSRRSER